MKTLIYDGVSEFVKCPECGESLGDQAKILGDIDRDDKTGPVLRPCSCGWKGRWQRLPQIPHTQPPAKS